MQTLFTYIEHATQTLPGRLTAAAPLAGLDGWDSLGMYNLIVLIEERHGLELAMEDLAACDTPADVMAVLQARGVAL